MKKNMVIKELIIEDDNEQYVDAISLVDYPAIELDWMKFNKVKKMDFKDTFSDAEKMIITGPAMVPNKLIYRIDYLTDEEFYVWFSRDTIEKIAIDFSKSSRNYNATYQHEKNITDVFVFESWIVKDNNNDKAKALGYDVPNGTWMVSMRINNPEIWDKIKTGEVKGFSIEGYFMDKLSNYNKEEDLKDIIYSDKLTDKEKVEKLLNKIKKK